MKDFSSEGYISETAATEIWPRLLFKYHMTKAKTPLHIVKGTFSSQGSENPQGGPQWKEVETQLVSKNGVQLRAWRDEKDGKTKAIPADKWKAATR